jgi:TPR repeat protein
MQAPPLDPREVRCRAGTAAPASTDCFLAGNAYDRGSEGHPPEREKAIELYAIGCKAHAGDPSCGALKNEIVSLQLTVSTRGEALALLESACGAGNLDLCNDLATAYREGIGVTPEPVRALTLFDRTCAAATDRAPTTTLEVSISGCRGVASLLRSGGVPPDEPRANRAESRAKDLAKELEQAPTPPGG